MGWKETPPGPGHLESKRCPGKKKETDVKAVFLASTESPLVCVYVCASTCTQKLQTCHVFFLLNLPAALRCPAGSKGRTGECWLQVFVWGP